MEVLLDSVWPLIVDFNLNFADRGEVQKGSAEIFFRKVKFWKEDGQEEAPPVFVGIILLKECPALHLGAELLIYMICEISYIIDSWEL